MCDVFSSREYDRVAELTCVVILEKSSKVEHLSEKADPAIVLGAVEGYFRGKVIPAQLIRSGQMGSI